MNKKIKMAILQPEVPHYREEFFLLLREKCGCMDIYVYNSFTKAKKNGFEIKVGDLKHAHNIQFHGILAFNPFTFLNSKYDTLVLMLHFAHITTWLLLLTKFIHRKRIILYGQGISVKRYLAEEKKPDWKLKLMIWMADGVWVYMDKEYRQWHQIFPTKKIVALGNTISGINEILSYKPALSPETIKAKYNITEQILFIFCARFTSPYRRVDLLIETIKRLDNKKFGFIIIGDGENKPDFTLFSNVHDFGAIYDTAIKRELFAIADVYFQPGWVGLSIVEAMAYGKPIFTFKRSEQTKQCVEYSYIENRRNGMVFTTINECIDFIENMQKENIVKMGNYARTLIKEKYTIEKMVNNAISIL